MASTSDVTISENGGAIEKIHPYLITMVRWCISYLWSSATVLLHRLIRAQVPQITASKPLKQKSRVAGKDHLDPEPKVECVVLHEPSSPTLDVIFVHGLYGSLGNTWKQGEWRKKYKIDPNVVQLRNHTSKSCDCSTKQKINNENKCKTNEEFTYITDLNERYTYENINERLKKVLPNENSFITEKFYNNTLLDDLPDNYETQAKFVNDLFNRTKNYERNENECNMIECKCKINERDCNIGCGCICDDCYSTCWPKDWIKVDFPGARVISINYTSDPYLWRPLWVKGNKRLRLHERAEQMMTQLLEIGVGRRPIIWVGHSKGGLFIKEIYCEAFEAHLKLSKMNETKTEHMNDISVYNQNKCNIINEYVKTAKCDNEDVVLTVKEYNEDDFKINFNNCGNRNEQNINNIVNKSHDDFNIRDSVSIQNAYILRTNVKVNENYNFLNEIYDEFANSDNKNKLNVNISKINEFDEIAINRASRNVQNTCISKINERNEVCDGSEKSILRTKDRSIVLSSNLQNNEFFNSDVDDGKHEENFDNIYNLETIDFGEFNNINSLEDDDLEVCEATKIVYGLLQERNNEDSLRLKDCEVLKRRADLWKNSAGFMFYSVPHRGSPLADIKTPITSRSIELLEISKDCPLVLTLQDRWLVASSPLRPAVRSLVETCRTLMSVLWLRIVSVDSADAGIGELSGVSVDHREICKPSSRRCLLYTQLTELIHTALNKCSCS